MDNLYYNYKTITYLKAEDKKIKYLSSSNLNLIAENIYKMLRNLHFADVYLIIDDSNNSYKNTNKITLIFSIVSISFSCCFLFQFYLR